MIHDVPFRFDYEVDCSLKLGHDEFCSHLQPVSVDGYECQWISVDVAA
jgi:hypothetical protein